MKLFPNGEFMPDSHKHLRKYYIQNWYFNIKIKRCGLIATKTTFLQRPSDIEHVEGHDTAFNNKQNCIEKARITVTICVYVAK